MRKVHRLVFKLGITFGLLITFLLGVGWLGLRWMARMDADFENTLHGRVGPRKVLSGSAALFQCASAAFSSGNSVAIGTCSFAF